MLSSTGQLLLSLLQNLVASPIAKRASQGLALAHPPAQPRPPCPACPACPAIYAGSPGADQYCQSRSAVLAKCCIIPPTPHPPQVQLVLTMLEEMGVETVVVSDSGEPPWAGLVVGGGWAKRCVRHTSACRRKLYGPCHCPSCSALSLPPLPTSDTTHLQHTTVYAPLTHRLHRLPTGRPPPLSAPPLPDTAWLRDPTEFLDTKPAADWFHSTDCLSHEVGGRVCGWVAGCVLRTVACLLPCLLARVPWHEPASLRASVRPLLPAPTRPPARPQTEAAWQPVHNQPRCGHITGNHWGRSFNTGGWAGGWPRDGPASVVCSAAPFKWWRDGKWLTGSGASGPPCMRALGTLPARRNIHCWLPCRACRHLCCAQPQGRPRRAARLARRAARLGAHHVHGDGACGELASGWGPPVRGAALGGGRGGGSTARHAPPAHMSVPYPGSGPPCPTPSLPLDLAEQRAAADWHHRSGRVQSTDRLCWYAGAARHAMAANGLGRGAAVGQRSAVVDTAFHVQAACARQRRVSLTKLAAAATAVGAAHASTPQPCAPLHLPCRQHALHPRGPPVAAAGQRHAAPAPPAHSALPQRPRRVCAAPALEVRA